MAGTIIAKPAANFVGGQVEMRGEEVTLAIYLEVRTRYDDGDPGVCRDPMAALLAIGRVRCRA
jgi:hypothetical protein